MKSYRNSGFTLIELMVAVAIVGILSAIAIPNYRNYVIRGARESAKTELLQLAAVQEKVYLNSTAYSASITTAYTGGNAGGLGHTSSTTSDGKYDLTITSVTPFQSYTIFAKPVATKAQAGNGCLTIQGNGLRQWFQNDDTCLVAPPTSW
jgi:type IV pilus assembly protein PilE